MRLSTSDPFELTRKIRVFFDGEPLDGVIMADEEAGEVEFYPKDAAGNWARLPGDRGAWLTMEKTGKVEIRCSPADRILLQKYCEVRDHAEAAPCG